MADPDDIESLEPEPQGADDVVVRMDRAYRNEVAGKVSAAVEDDPDKAARADALSRATGTPPEMIHENLEEFEQDHKNQLSQHIVDSNEYLRDYVQSHPLAASVSNDDWANLDAATTSTRRVASKGLFENASDILGGMWQGVKDIPKELVGAKKFEDVEFDKAMVDYLVQLGMPPEQAKARARMVERRMLRGSAISTIAMTIGGSIFYPKTTAAFIAGSIPFRTYIAQPIEKETGFPAEATETYAMVLLAGLGIKSISHLGKIAEDGRPYFRAGQEPPPGVNEIFDKIKSLQADLDAQNLDDALKDAQKSETRERSPELYAEAMRKVTQGREIEISADAVRRLYGEKEPAPEDGVLGWVPDIVQQLRSSEVTGNVRVPLADWLSKVDPEVARELHDDIRVREGGVTKNEAKEALEARSARELPPLEVRPYPDEGDVPINNVRESSGMTPLWDRGPESGLVLKEVSIEERIAESQARERARQAGARGKEVALTGWEYVDPGFQDVHISELLRPKYRYFDIQDLGGKPIGNMEVFMKPDGGLYVGWMGTQKGPLSIGPRAVRGLLAQIRQAFPEAKYIEGYRVTGARNKEGKIGQARMEFEERAPAERISLDLKDHAEAEAALRRLVGEEPEELDWEKIAHRHEARLLRDGGTPAERELYAEVSKVVDRLLPEGLEAHYPVRGLREEGTPSRGLYVRYTDQLPVIFYSITAKDPIGILRHEAIHHLYSYGFFSEKEWHTLKRAAIDEGWIEKHQIKKRYPELDHGDMLEEAIADEFANWSMRPDQTHRAATAFGKLRMLVDRVKELLTGRFGFEPTADDIFAMVETGEIGRRGIGKIEGKEAFDPRKAIEPKAAREKEDPIFERAAAIGMTKERYEASLRRMQEQNAEDIQRQIDKASKEIRRRQGKEWKENEAKVRTEVTEGVNKRPDISADNFLRAQDKAKIDISKVPEELRKSIPKEFMDKKGINPDMLGASFGYSSGRAMLERLAQLNVARKRLGLSPKEYVKKLIDEGTEDQMRRKYGDLDENILKEAQDHVVGETQIDLIYEQLLGLAMKAGQKLPLSKENVLRDIRDIYNDMPIGALKVDKLLAEAGKTAARADTARAKEDHTEAFRQWQRHHMLAVMANAARKLRKRMDAFEKLAKKFSKEREVKGTNQDHTNFIRLALSKVGFPPSSGMQDLADAIAGSGFKTLEEFGEHIENEIGEDIMSDFLLDPKWSKKDWESMTASEFESVGESIKAMAKHGRDVSKVIREGEAVDKAMAVEELVNQLKSLPWDPKQVDIRGEPRKDYKYKLKSVLLNLLPFERQMSRIDKDDPSGPFTQYISRLYTESDNAKEAAKKVYARRMNAIPKIKGDPGAKVDNHLFYDPYLVKELPPGTVEPMSMTHGNVLAILRHMGNASNRMKLARGWNVNEQALLKWVFDNTTKEHWEWAQKWGDLYASLKDEHDRMRRRVTGIAAEDVDIQPINTPFGQFRGWYNHIEYDPRFPQESQKLRGGDLFQKTYFRGTTSVGALKKRTGYIGPVSLNLGSDARIVNQILHDIHFREAGISTYKLMTDKRLQAAVARHMGLEYVDSMKEFAKSMINAENVDSPIQLAAEHHLEWMRQNTIHSMIGWNPRTVQKHFLSALINSMTETGLRRFVKEFVNLLARDPATSETNWRFAHRNSQEIQRRTRNWQESLGAAADVNIHEMSFAQMTRHMAMKGGSAPVALSDLVSAVPTWNAEYRKGIEEGLPHGSAVFLAERAVRGAHGSTALTYRPKYMRSGAAGQWFMSLYGFFNSAFVKNYETVWKTGDIFREHKRSGDWNKAKEYSPAIAGNIISRVLWVAAVEQLVTPLTSDEREGMLWTGAKAVVRGLAMTVPIVRDLADYVLSEGRHEPSVGLFSAAIKSVQDISTDVGRALTRKGFTKDHAGQMIQHFMTASGTLFGLGTAQVGKTLGFGYDWLIAGKQHPKSPGDVWEGISTGRIKRKGGDIIYKLLHGGKR